MKECQRDGCSTETSNKKYCSNACSNSAQPRRKRTLRYERPCQSCSAPTTNQKYCNAVCQMEYQYREKVRIWLAGGYVTTGIIRRYLIETRGEACEECGWAKRHPITGKVPLAVDHTDGHWTDNVLTNLKLLCGCCHSLTPTFGALDSNARRAMLGLDQVSESRRTAGVM